VCPAARHRPMSPGDVRSARKARLAEQDQANAVGVLVT
jgi:hypothetical protein